MRTALLTLSLLLVAACSKTPQATGAADTATPTEPAAQEQPLQAATPPETPPEPVAREVPAKATTAPECETAADCPKDQVCRGPEGCDAVWACQEPRPCTRDLVPFCGCDGQTFHASSTCPIRKYSSQSPCSPGDRLAPQPKPCSTSADCGEGQTCQGPEGCTKPWRCLPARRCTRDIKPFCGCDGTTFSSSSSCPARPYSHRGKCE